MSRLADAWIVASIVLAIMALCSAAVAAEPGARGPASPFGFSGNSGNDTLTVFDLGTGTAVGPDGDSASESGDTGAWI